MKTMIFAIAFVAGVNAYADQPVASGPAIGVTVELPKQKCSGPVTGVVEKTNEKGKPVLQEVRVKVKTKGFSGKVRFAYHYTTDGFEVPASMYGREIVAVEESTTDTEVTFKFLPLRGDRLYANTLIVVTGIDKNSNVARGAAPFIVSREAIVKRDDDASLACVQVRPAIMTSGLYENQNDTDMVVTTSVGTTKVIEERKSKTLGWSIVPSVFNGGWGISLFGLNGSRLNAVAQQVNETTYTAVTNTLNPGDAGFRYMQTTRVKEPYSIFVANGCGQFKQVEDQKIFLEREITVHNLYKVSSPYNPKALDEVIKNRTFGREVINTCQTMDENAIPLPF